MLALCQVITYRSLDHFTHLAINKKYKKFIALYGSNLPTHSFPLELMLSTVLCQQLDVLTHKNKNEINNYSNSFFLWDTLLPFLKNWLYCEHFSRILLYIPSRLFILIFKFYLDALYSKRCDFCSWNFFEITRKSYD